MKLIVNKEDQKFVLLNLIDEKLDSRLAPGLKAEFISLSSAGVTNVLLNMKDVKYVDSSGLSAILTANRLYAAAGGGLYICCLQPHVKKLMEISHLTSVLNILPTQEEAREAIYMDMIEKEVKEDTES